MDSRAEVLVTVEQLPAALAAGAQLLDVRWTLGEQRGAGFGRYVEGHLPGARYLDLEAVLTGPTTDPTLGRHPLPGAAQLGAGLGALGIDPARPIVVYDEPGSFAAGRAWWVLRWAGLDARVLDGGIKAWVAAGRELESGEPATTPCAPLELTTGHLPTQDAAQVASFDGVLIDVRAPERFRGEVEPIDARAGHIPGALNVPVTALWDEAGRLPSAEQLRALLPTIPEPDEGPEPRSTDRAGFVKLSRHGRGIPEPDEGPRVTVYCGSGVSAAQAVLALASLGIGAALYPASWSGWSSDPARPAATGAA